jgi:hypothetical protein
MEKRGAAWGSALVVLATWDDYEWFSQLVVPQLEAEEEEANKRWLAQREKSEEARKK